MKQIWSALSDTTRREILSMLKSQDMTAGDIAKHFDTTAPTISHHLNVLREAGLIESEKKAQVIIYRINATVFQSFLKTFLELFDKKGEQ